MKTLNNIPIYFMGDNHGEYDAMFHLIKKHDIKDCYFIHLGDGGEGFIPFIEKQLRQFEFLNTFFKSRNIQYKSIRGNHSDPYYFKENRVSLSNFELIEDYTIMEYDGKLIQFIGGATSVDRTSRTEGRTYWQDEFVSLERDKCKKVDILITHTAPSRCFPSEFTEIVYNWALRDACLMEDLTEERQIMDEIFKICQPSLHLYGHFHSSNTEEINGCKHKLLAINEIWEYR